MFRLWKYGSLTAIIAVGPVAIVGVFVAVASIENFYSAAAAALAVMYYTVFQFVLISTLKREDFRLGYHVTFWSLQLEHWPNYLGPVLVIVAAIEWRRIIEFGTLAKTYLPL